MSDETNLGISKYTIDNPEVIWSVPFISNAMCPETRPLAAATYVKFFHVFQLTTFKHLLGISNV